MRNECRCPFASKVIKRLTWKHMENEQICFFGAICTIYGYKGHINRQATFTVSDPQEWIADSADWYMRYCTQMSLNPGQHSINALVGEVNNTQRTFNAFSFIFSKVQKFCVLSLSSVGLPPQQDQRKQSLMPECNQVARQKTAFPDLCFTPFIAFLSVI